MGFIKICEKELGIVTQVCYIKIANRQTTLKGVKQMLAEKEMKEARKAIAYDLIEIIDQKPEQSTYTSEEIKNLIKVYVATANQ